MCKELDETATLLLAIPGGRELLEKLDGDPNFGDAEVHILQLDRKGPSLLCIETQGRRPTRVTFELSSCIDVALRGFSKQNVISGLKLRYADEREIEPWEVGVGLEPGNVEIELAPCFGAYGTIRARILAVTFEQLRDGPRSP